MDKFKNTDHRLYWTIYVLAPMIWGEGNVPPLLVGVKTCTTALEISMAISHKIRNNLLQDMSIPLLGI